MTGHAVTLRERFEDKFIPEPNSGCWLWTAGVCSGHGMIYGAIRLDRCRVMERAHRVSWLLHKGSIPDGMQVLHRCDVSLCVNPDHLFLGTHSDNMSDRQTKHRQAKGSSLSFLTEEQAISIRSDRRRGNDIAADHGISRQTVYHIRSGFRWKHLGKD